MNLLKRLWYWRAIRKTKRRAELQGYIRQVMWDDYELRPLPVNRPLKPYDDTKLEMQEWSETVKGPYMQALKESHRK